MRAREKRLNELKDEGDRLDDDEVARETNLDNKDLKSFHIK